MPKPVAREKLDQLTSLRFFAAALVVAGHACDIMNMPEGTLGPINTGHAVCFFFVLSGFILAYVYPSLGSWSEARRFLLARIARIYPLHLFCIGLLLLCAPWSQAVPAGFSWLTLGLAALMVHTWVPFGAFYSALNGPSWSIATEFFFYLCFPLLILGFKRNWPWKLAGSFLLVVGVVIACKALHLPTDPKTDISQSYAFEQWGLIYPWPITRLFEFVMGMTVAVAYARLRPWYQCQAWLATLVEILVLGIALLSMWYVDAVSAWVSKAQWMPKAGITWLYHIGQVVLPYSLVILVLGLGRGWISSVLRSKVLVLLGEMSFAVYLVHMTVLMFASQYVFGDDSAAFSGFPTWLIVLAMTTAIMLLSHLAWTRVERPAREIILHRFHRAGRAGVDHKVPPSIAIPGGRRWFDHVAEPHWWISAVEIGLVILLGWETKHINRTAPLIQQISGAQAAAMVGHGQPLAAGVEFGDRFTLLSMNSNAADDDFDPGKNSVKLHLAWRADAQVSLEQSVGIDLLDGDGNTIDTHEYEQDSRESLIPSGTLWVDEVEVPVSKLREAKSIAIRMYKPGSGRNEESVPLPPDRGPRDQDGKRLVLQVSDDPALAALQTDNHKGDGQH
jgi:peptidoglycan/LPS O-acetylase OafA/YrhL